MKMGIWVQYQNKEFCVLVFFALASICGCVITQGVLQPRRNIFTGIINETTLGAGVQADLFELNHMLVTEWGQVYVGAVNRIYELEPDLRIVSIAETGPVNDSKKCLPDPKVPECSDEKRLTDNYNKVLIYYQGSKEKLLTCGSVYQGACEARNLRNISRAHTYYETESILDYAVAANDPYLSTVAFIAPGPGEFAETEVLYVAATYTGSSDLRTSLLRGPVPALSTRSLGKNRFHLLEKSVKLSGIYLTKEVRSNYLIKYITGFSSDSYSYFLTQQPETPLTPGVTPKTVSKVISICQDDTYYNSYVDMPLVCQSKSGKVYNYLQAARVTKASKNLQLSFGLRSAEDILIGVFTDLEGDPDANSAVCLFTMQFIRKQLQENAQKCYSGEDISGGGYLTKKQCKELVSYQLPL